MEILSDVRIRPLLLLFLAIFVAGGQSVRAQVSTSDNESESIKLFQSGQEAHARGDFKIALDCYDQAIKLRPEFPEAEHQRATALFQLGRLQEAEAGFRHAIELQPDWAPPIASLGMMLASTSKQDEAIRLLTEALKIDPKNQVVLRTFSNLVIPVSASKSTLEAALDLVKSVNGTEAVPGLNWVARGMLEEALSDDVSAMSSFDQAIAAETGNSIAYARRAELRASRSDLDHAIDDAQLARKLAPSSTSNALLLANIYLKAGRNADALATLDSLPSNAKQSSPVVSFRNKILAMTADGPDARASLEAALQKDPQNASVLARLGALYRIDDPSRSLDYYRRAAALEPRNPDFATGFASALVQARRFDEAAGILRRVLGVDASNVAAHANLATALYELKSYPDAIAEYNWLLAQNSSLTVAYFFIGSAYDRQGHFKEALAAYQSFMEKADPTKNQLEIDKIKLRLPSLREQIRHGEGVKQTKSKQKT